jgi:hypothetical protein
VANACVLGFIFWQLRPHIIDGVAAPFFAHGVFQLSRNWLFVSQYKWAFEFLRDLNISGFSRPSDHLKVEKVPLSKKLK